MPNHCENDLWILGRESTVRDLYNRYFTTEDPDKNYINSLCPNLDCNKVIPYPKRFTDMDQACKNLREIAKRKNIEIYGKTREELSALLSIPLENVPWIKDRYPIDGFNSGGYEWCLANWGTKWGTYNPWNFRWLKNKGLRVSFLTAWSPPLPVLEKLSVLNPGVKIKLRFYEAGMGFQGLRIWKDGECLEENDGSYRGHRGG